MNENITPDWQHTATQMGHNPAFGPTPPQPPKKKRGLLIAGITVGALGLIGIANAAGSGATTAIPAVTATATPSSSPTSDWDAPGDEPTETTTPEPEVTEEAVDTTLKYGQKLWISMDDVPVSIKFEAPMRSTNMFDKDNAETKLTICNTGDEALDDLSVGSTGAWLEDNDGGTYDSYGAYRTPEFPIYDADSKKLRAGKCLTGWVGWEGAWGSKGLAVAMDVDVNTYTWSKTGK